MLSTEDDHSIQSKIYYVKVFGHFIILLITELTHPKIIIITVTITKIVMQIVKNWFDRRAHF